MNGTQKYAWTGKMGVPLTYDEGKEEPKGEKI